MMSCAQDCWHRAQDPEILAWAVSERRVLITYDSDFTDLIFRDKAPPPPAVIYIRDEPIDLPGLAARIVTLVGGGCKLGHMHIVGEIDFRHRKFPSE